VLVEVDDGDGFVANVADAVVVDSTFGVRFKARTVYY
jgi:hypothetical protein